MPSSGMRRLVAGGLALLLVCINAMARAEDASAPLTFMWDPAVLLENRAELLAGDERLQPALDALVKQAEQSLKIEPPSVVNKAQVPPSGDKHDYMSQAPYCWPNPVTEDGLPYIHRDGEVCPERADIPDAAASGTMARNVEILALAYWFTGDERYAEHAAEFIRTWFLNPETRMNPNLNYTQRWPGLFEGRPYGILDVWRITIVVDSIGLLAGSRAWTDEDHTAAEAWFAEYLEWLRTSDLGDQAEHSSNNHGSWYDVQVMSYAQFLGRDGLAVEFAEQAKQRRIAAHIEPDGSQPQELKRTKSWSYSIYNLEALFRIAVLADRAGVDLWNWESEDGRSLRGALEYLVPYGRDHSGWEYKQITDWHNGGLCGLLYEAANAYGSVEYRVLADELSCGADPAHRRNLLQPRLGE